MIIDYNTLTEDQLEKWVEFIDWSMMPSRLLTPRVIKEFSPVFKKLGAKIWLKELLNSFDVKVDKKRYPDLVFFFKGEEMYMELNEKTGRLWCSHEKVWSVFQKNTDLKYHETQMFIKNVAEMHFKNMEVTPKTLPRHLKMRAEMHFKNMEVTPSSMLKGSWKRVKVHFKNMEVTPIRGT